MATSFSTMRIPVFVSAPSPDNLNPAQEESAEIIHDLIRRYKLEWRALGRSDYPIDLPLKEVLRMVKHCSGGIILGFEQFWAKTGTIKRGVKRKPGVEKKEEEIKKPRPFPTPWNHLEAGILFSAGLPTMIFREEGISGGIFDIGTSEVFIHRMPTSKMGKDSMDELDSVFINWVARVRRHYYDE